MEDNERDLMFTLIRKYNEMRTDYIILMGIAVISQSSGKPVSDLVRRLDEARRSPYHQSQRESTEQLLAHFGRTADADALIRWIGETPKGSLPN
jgi:hypothetical protein